MSVYCAGCEKRAATFDQLHPTGRCEPFAAAVDKAMAARDRPRARRRLRALFGRR